MPTTNTSSQSSVRQVSWCSILHHNQSSNISICPAGALSPLNKALARIQNDRRQVSHTTDGAYLDRCHDEVKTRLDEVIDDEDLDKSLKTTLIQPTMYKAKLYAQNKMASDGDNCNSQL